jgi:hypothetical protein
VEFVNPVNQTAAMTAGTNAAVSLSTPGQVFVGSFAGTAGTEADVITSSWSIPNCAAVNLRNPDGSVLVGQGVCGATFLAAVHLPTTGTYTIEIDPAGNGTGTANVEFVNPVNQAPKLKLNGAATSVSLPVSGAIFAGTLSAAAGNEVTVTVSGASFGGMCWQLQIVDPLGNSLDSTVSCTAATGLSAVGLPRAGTYLVEIVPSGNVTGTATLTVTGLQVLPPPTGAVVNKPYSATLVVKPGTSPYSFAVTSGSLPPGLSLNSSTGAITGTPTTLGSYPFTVTVTDAQFQTASVATVINVVNPLQITTASPLPGGTAGTPYSTTINATGGTAPYTFSVSSGALPPGLALDSATGDISGTPTTPGTYSFTIKVKDANKPPLSKTKSFSVTIS